MPERTDNKRNVNLGDAVENQSRDQRLEAEVRQRANDVRYVLNDEQGRRFLWRLMAECHTFESVWHASARIHYNAGQQDLGHMILGWAMDASPKAYLLGQQEDIKRKEQQRLLEEKEAIEEDDNDG